MCIRDRYKDASFEEGKEESLKPKIMMPLAESDKKETKVKVSKRDKQPKSQSAAVMEMAKTMKEAADLQEKNNDQRLTTLLEAERKRDDMFLTFQLEQAEANRKNDMFMAQMLMQMNRNASPANMYIPHLPIHLKRTLCVNRQGPIHTNTTRSRSQQMILLLLNPTKK